VTKRLFDIAASFTGLVVMSPVLAIAALLVKADSRGPVLFQQERVGRDFEPFRIWKFRTMTVPEPSERRDGVTVGADPRITRVGRLLRKTKVDELPQLYNVLRGDMSLVGPRPELRRYVQMFERDYREILQCRPGITDLASIKYRDEARLLALAADPETEYVARLLPDKIRLAKEYVARRSVVLDLQIILRSLWAVVAGTRKSRV
jgi:lipopolysaccharide/colanic/teichoic acid biosynthesis glycosyltransferase